MTAYRTGLSGTGRSLAEALSPLPLVIDTRLAREQDMAF
jgi:hypothetical protein